MRKTTTKNRNSSVWIAKSKRKGLNLKFLHQEKGMIFDVLDELDLPHPKHYIIPQKKIDSAKTREIFGRTNCFCRLTPKDGGERPYRLNLESHKEFAEFCSEHNLSNYTIMLVERGNVTYSGSIIATEESRGIQGKCIVEMIKGTGEDLSHSLKIPISASVEFLGKNWFRTIRYDEGIKPTEEEAKFVLRALRHIGVIKDPLPGYYEFEVYDDKRILFKNFQSQRSQYAKLLNYKT